MIMHDAAVYEEESYLAQDKQINIYGHLDVSILTSILDIPLPDAVIIDYLHSIERLQVDSRLTKQNFSQYFNRKMKAITLFVCFTRLLHGQSIVGLETGKLADELFQQFYRDHDEHYYGLQNLVLHLHTDFVTMYQNHSALSNIECFGQEDLIGSVESNHHGTRYYGESIAYYYNIDFSLHNKSKTNNNNE
ncbi:unnamed protein product [Rotaria sordida]|nr:unnamed protein product [Rotaria sordida]